MQGVKRRNVGRICTVVACHPECSEGSTCRRKRFFVVLRMTGSMAQNVTSRLRAKARICDVPHILCMNYCIDSPQPQDYNDDRVASLSTLIVTSYAKNVVSVLHCMTSVEGESRYETCMEKCSVSAVPCSSHSCSVSCSSVRASRVRFCPERL